MRTFLIKAVEPKIQTSKFCSCLSYCFKKYRWKDLGFVSSNRGLIYKTFLATVLFKFCPNLFKSWRLLTVEGARIAQLVVLGLAVHSVAGSILLWGHFPVEGIFPLELTWVQTPFPPKTLSDESINRGLVCAHMHFIARTQKILTFMS